MYAIAYVRPASTKPTTARAALVALLTGLTGTAIILVPPSISWIQMELTVQDAIPIVVSAARLLQTVLNAPYPASTWPIYKTQHLFMGHVHVYAQAASMGRHLEVWGPIFAYSAMRTALYARIIPPLALNASPISICTTLPAPISAQLALWQATRQESPNV